MIPYSKHYIDKKDIDAVADVLRNKNIAQGELIGKLEEKISKYVKSKYAVAVTNGSVALDLAVEALELSPGDEVILPSFTIISKDDIPFVKLVKNPKTIAPIKLYHIAVGTGASFEPNILKVINIKAPNIVAPAPNNKPITE